MPIDVSLNGLIKLLESIPIWKKVKELPDKIIELEKRVAYLEKQAKSPKFPRCPFCGEETFRVFTVERRGGFNELTYKCDSCKQGKIEREQWVKDRRKK